MFLHILFQGVNFGKKQHGHEADALLPRFAPGKLIVIVRL
jgi:hypothetical protein